MKGLMLLAHVQFTYRLCSNFIFNDNTSSNQIMSFFDLRNGSKFIGYPGQDHRGSKLFFEKKMEAKTFFHNISKIKISLFKETLLKSKSMLCWVK